MEFKITAIERAGGVAQVEVEALDGSGRGGLYIPDDGLDLPKLGDIVDIENMGKVGCRLRWPHGHLVWNESRWERRCTDERLK